MIPADRIRFEDHGHRYYLDGRRVPSITQSLKPATFDEFDHVKESVLERKRAKGIDFHTMVEDLANDRVNLEAYDFDLLPDFDALQEWLAKSGGTIVAAEKIVASYRWRFAGRLDLVLHLPWLGETMVDIKRTYAVPASVGPQTAGQVLAWKETMTDEPIRGFYGMPRACLHVKDGSCRLVHCESKTDYATFLAALTVTHWRESHGK